MALTLDRRVSSPATTGRLYVLGHPYDSRDSMTLILMKNDLTPRTPMSPVTRANSGDSGDAADSGNYPIGEL